MSSTLRGSLSLKPIKLESNLVDLLESNNIVSCACLDNTTTHLIALSCGEVYRVGSNGAVRLKFSPSLLSSALPESVASSGGHRASGAGFLSAAVAAVGLTGGVASGQPTWKIDVSKIFRINKISAIVSANNGDNYYVNQDVLKDGHLIGGGTGVITAVSSLGTSCIAGNQSGKIFLVNTTSRPPKVGGGGSLPVANSLIDTVPLGACKMVYELPVNSRITDLVYHESATFAGCFVSTLNCLYLFSTKPGGTNKNMFAAGSAQLVWESPRPFIGSRIRIHAQVPELKESVCVSWLNGACIITSPIEDLATIAVEIRPHTTSLGGIGTTQNLVGKSIEESDKKITNIGDFFAVTEYFYLVQYETKLVAISRILPSSQAVHQLATSGGSNASSGPSYGTLHEVSGSFEMVFSTKRMYSVGVTNEKVDAWKYFLRRKNFSAALASVDESNVSSRALILKAEADNMLATLSSEDNHDMMDKIGDLYSRALVMDPPTISPFVNEIIGKLSMDRKNSLKFLLTKLDSIGRDDDEEDNDVIQVQVSVLFIYIASLFVEELASDRKSKDLDSMFVQFIQDRFQSLNMECIKAVYELLEANGMFTEIIMVAETVGDTEKAIRVDMETGNFLGIINRISSTSSSSSFLTHDEEDMLIRIAPVLFRFHPSEFIDLMIKKRKILTPDKFLTSVISASGALTLEHKEHVVRYLEFSLLEDGSSRHRSEYLMNVLIELKCLLVSEMNRIDESGIMHLLESVSGRKDFSSEFVMRTLRHYGLKRSEALLLAIDGEYLKATRMALSLPDIELAKEIAWRPKSRSTQKWCWLTIIETMSDMEEAVATFREAEVLDVVDLVSILNKRGVEKVDGVIFREICDKLASFEETGKALEEEIVDYSQALELIRNDLRKSRMNTCAVLSHSQKCEICLKLLYNEQFIVFNTCGHCFHSECLKEVCTLRLMNKHTQTDIDDTICCSCVLCGEESMLLETLFTPFVDPSLDAAEIDSWTIKAI